MLAQNRKSASGLGSSVQHLYKLVPGKQAVRRTYHGTSLRLKGAFGPFQTHIKISRESRLGYLFIKHLGSIAGTEQVSLRLLAPLIRTAAAPDHLDARIRVSALTGWYPGGAKGHFYRQTSKAHVFRSSSKRLKLGAVEEECNLAMLG